MMADFFCSKLKRVRYEIDFTLLPLSVLPLLLPLAPPPPSRPFPATPLPLSLSLLLSDSPPPLSPCGRAFTLHFPCLSALRGAQPMIVD